MNQKNIVRIFSHIIIWCIVLLTPLYFMFRSGEFETVPYISFVVRVFVIAILFYINYLYLIEKLLFERKFILYFIINVILIGVLITFQNIFLDVINTMPQMIDSVHDHRRHDFDRGPRPPMIFRVLTDYLLIVFVIGLSVAIKMTVRWSRDSINLEKVRSIQLEADLRNLRSQLNPHFLFNTLNNIYSLIAIDKNKAQDSVHRLSNMLRYVLYEDDRKFVPINKELEFTQNYIDLMSLRVGSNVKLNVVIENKGSTDLIASLMFVTLIENGFKHGIVNGEESFIDIKILVEKGKGVLCTVVNSISNRANKTLIEKNSGIGLSNLSKRLKLLYPGKYEFNTEKRNNEFLALLRIDFDTKHD